MRPPASAAPRSGGPRLLQLGWELAQRDLAQRYRGTVFGTLWPFLNSAATLLVFTLIFSGVLRVRWPHVAGVETRPAEGALMIFAGLIPYLFLAEVMGRAPTTIVSVPNLVKKIRFPLEVLPFVVVATALVLSLVNSAILAVAAALLLGTLPPTILALPLLYVPLILFLLFAAALLAILGVFFRDTAQIAPFVVQLMLFLAPVCYPIDQVPAAFLTGINCNPLTYFVDEFRSVALLGRELDWGRWGIETAGWAIAAFVGMGLFRRVQPMFADML